MGYVTERHRTLIGQPGPRQTAATPVSEDMLRRFVQAVMESDPMHWDPAGARERGHDRVVAPPLFPLHASRRAPGTPDPLDRLAEDPDWDGAGGGGMGGLAALDLPLKRILNGGTEAEFFQLARIGDIVSSQSRYVQIEDREGRSGPMVIATVETEYTNQDDALLMRVRTTIINR
jgi:acyl dehydratase